MACRTLDLRIVSADDLRPVTLFHGMEVYVVVAVQDDLTYNNRKQRTPVDRTGGNNPRWNFPIKLAVNEAALLGNRLTLKFELFTRRTLLPDAHVGEVNVPGLELVSLAGRAGVNNVSYQVEKESGKPIGVLNISYMVGDGLITPVVTRGVGTNMYPMKRSHGHAGHAYPAQPEVGTGMIHVEPSRAHAGHAYPGQPEVGTGMIHMEPSHTRHAHRTQPGLSGSGLGYEYPAQHGGSGYNDYPEQVIASDSGYEYPTQHGGSGYAYSAQDAPSGYANPPPQQIVQPRRRRNNNLGMGLGAGLVGGAVGGLVAGELVSDMGHNNDGYDDGGYDDNGYDDSGYDDNGYEGGYDDGGFDI